MKQQSLEILQKAQVSDCGEAVTGQVQVLQVDILVEILDGFDVVVGEGQPRQQVHFLQLRSSANLTSIKREQIRHQSDLTNAWLAAEQSNVFHCVE